MKLPQLVRYACILPLAILFLSCSKDTPSPTTGSFSFEMESLVGDSPLILNTQTYTKTDAQTFTVSKFKYLMSNVKLLKADGSSYAVPNSYYLIDAAVDASKDFVISNIPFGTYTGVSFIVGVDSVRNYSGAQTGALDLNNDMYWDWATGYIFMKMEGKSPQAPAPAGATQGGLVFHMGGAKSPNNNVRTISPSFNGSTLVVSAGHVPEIHMSVNLMNLFAGPDPINFQNTSNVMSPPGAAPLVANYTAGMFSVEHIHPN